MSQTKLDEALAYVQHLDFAKALDNIRKQTLPKSMKTPPDYNEAHEKRIVTVDAIEMELNNCNDIMMLLERKADFILNNKQSIDRIKGGDWFFNMSLFGTLWGYSIALYDGKLRLSENYNGNIFAVSYKTGKRPLSDGSYAMYKKTQKDYYLPNLNLHDAVGNVIQAATKDQYIKSFCTKLAAGTKLLEIEPFLDFQYSNSINKGEFIRILRILVQSDLKNFPPRDNIVLDWIKTKISEPYITLPEQREVANYKCNLNDSQINNLFEQLKDKRNGFIAPLTSKKTFEKVIKKGQCGAKKIIWLPKAKNKQPHKKALCELFISLRNRNLIDVTNQQIKVLARNCFQHNGGDFTQFTDSNFPTEGNPYNSLQESINHIVSNL